MVTKHFDRSEFSCSCKCGFDAVDIELVMLLERVREHFKLPVNLTNACRCLKHNKSVGSKDTSQHVRGKAADFWIENTEPQEIADYLEDILQGTGGIGIYNNFVHVDVRDDKMARWRSE